MSRVLRCIALCLLLFPEIGWSQAPASASPPGYAEGAASALRLVRALNIRPQVTEGMSDIFEPGDARALAKYILDRDQTFWSTYESGLVALLQKRFTKDELRRLADFYDSDLGRTWEAQQPEILKEQFDQLKRGEGPLSSVAEISCTLAEIVPFFAQAKLRAGIVQPGVPTNLMPRIEPLINSTRRFCACVLKEAAKKLGPNYLKKTTDIAFLRQTLVKSGVCKKE